MLSCEADVPGDRADTVEPSIHDRSIVLDPTQPYLRAELQVADSVGKRLRKCQSSVSPQSGITIPLGLVKEHQRLVQRYRAYRAFQQELRLFWAKLRIEDCPFLSSPAKGKPICS